MKISRGSLKGMAVTLALAASVVAFGIPASAVHDEGFALQGDVDHSTFVDWVDLFDVTAGVATRKATLPTGFIQASFKADHVEPDPSAYATGSKDIYRIGDGVDANPATGNSGWQCKESNNIGSKFNLVNAYAAAFRNASNQLIVTFGSEITSPNGNRNAGVWLLQDNNVGCTPSGGGGTNFAGEHRDGDVFIVSAFTGGGVTSNVTVYRWVGDDATGSLVLRFTTGELSDAECDNVAINDPPIEDKACAIVNKAAEVNPPWTAPDADGGDLNVNEFYEGAVNLTALGLPECFANVVANSRSSQEPGSTLHDFTAGSFQTCSPSTTMLNTAAAANPSTVVAGQSTTLTFYEKNNGDLPLSNVSVSTDYAGCTPAKTAGDTGSDNILGVGEEWTFTCTTSFSTTGTKTVTATGTGTSTIGVVTYCADPATPPSGTICDQDERTSVTVTVVNPSTELTMTASAVITYTFSERNDGDVPLSAVSVSDSNCDTGTDPVYQSGDGTPPGDPSTPNLILEPGETWVFTCTKTLPGPTGDTGTATTTNAGVGTGTTPAPDSKPVTFCAAADATKHCKANERDRVKVTIENLSRGADPAP